jgi:hypothetical protein
VSPAETLKNGLPQRHDQTALTCTNDETSTHLHDRIWGTTLHIHPIFDHNDAGGRSQKIVICAEQSPLAWTNA